MNVERGIRRIVIVFSVPLAVAGASLALYGFGRAYFISKSIPGKASVDTPAIKLPKGYVLDQPSKPPFDPRKPFKTVSETDGFVPDQTAHEYGFETGYGSGAPKDGSESWRMSLGKISSAEILLNQISDLKGTGFVGVLMLGLSGLMWVLFSGGRWVIRGFRE